MRALTVRQPWSWAIIHGGKNIENRDWGQPSLTGRIAIHAGLTQDEGGYPAIRRILDLDTLGVCRVAEAAVCGFIVGTVEVVRIHRAYMMLGDDGLMVSCHRPWGMPTRFHWELANPRPCEPIPCRGALGLWTVPDDIAARLAVTDRG